MWGFLEWSRGSGSSRGLIRCMQKGLEPNWAVFPEVKVYRGLHPWESVLIFTFIYLKGFSDSCELAEIYTEQVLCHVMAV